MRYEVNRLLSAARLVTRLHPLLHPGDKETDAGTSLRSYLIATSMNHEYVRLPEAVEIVAKQCLVATGDDFQLETAVSTLFELHIKITNSVKQFVHQDRQLMIEVDDKLASADQLAISLAKMNATFTPQTAQLIYDLHDVLADIADSIGTQPDARA